MTLTFSSFSLALAALGASSILSALGPTSSWADPATSYEPPRGSDHRRQEILTVGGGVEFNKQNKATLLLEIQGAAPFDESDRRFLAVDATIGLVPQGPAPALPYIQVRILPITGYDRDTGWSAGWAPITLEKDDVLKMGGGAIRVVAIQYDEKRDDYQTRAVAKRVRLLGHFVAEAVGLKAGGLGDKKLGFAGFDLARVEAEGGFTIGLGREALAKMLVGGVGDFAWGHVDGGQENGAAASTGEANLFARVELQLFNELIIYAQGGFRGAFENYEHVAHLPQPDLDGNETQGTRYLQSGVLLRF